MEFLGIYGSYVKMFFKARMEYRFSFFLGIFANFYCYFITYITFWVIIQNFGSINGWSFNDLSLLYSLNLLTYSITGMLFWGVLGLEHQITSGNLDACLIRPMGVIKQLICKKFTDTFIGQAVVTIIFLTIALQNLQAIMSPLKYVYLVIIIFSGVLIQSGAMILFGSLSFWMNRSLELSDILYYNLRMFIQYPLSIFPIFVRLILTFILPWAFINYYPALLLLGKQEVPHYAFMGFLSPIIGILFFLLSIFVFNRGLRRYSSSGS